MNGPLHTFIVHIERRVEEMVEVQAETEHEAGVAAGPGLVRYIYRKPEAEPERETTPKSRH